MRTPEQARAWLAEELRSGNWQQGKKNLEFKGGNGSLRHCCAGVACRLFIADGGELELSYTNEDGGFVTSFNGNSGTLPRPVSDWLGLHHDNPSRYNDTMNLTKFVAFETERGNTKVTSQGSCLTSLNDQGVDFKAIADLIEKGYLKCRPTTTGNSGLQPSDPTPTNKAQEPSAG